MICGCGARVGAGDCRNPAHVKLAPELRTWGEALWTARDQVERALEEHRARVERIREDLFANGARIA